MKQEAKKVPAKTKLEVMKEKLQQTLHEYIAGMDRAQLYAFLAVINDFNISELPAGGKRIRLPKEVLTCDRCDKLYGECSTEPGDLTKVCKERFFRYCQEPAQEAEKENDRK